MKKTLVLLLAFLLIFSCVLVSCKIDETANNDDTVSNISTTTTGIPDNKNDDTPSIKTESEIALKMYESALNNEIKVYETDLEEYHYLKDCKTPYNRIPLCELEGLKYVYMDVDGDQSTELVIGCGDTLILRYYEGIVYVYPFTFRNMHQLNTDGSYSWNYTGQDFEYGENQLAFDGAELKAKEIWRIVNDGEPNAEYYVDGVQVTLEEILTYFENHPKTEITFKPFELSLENAISPEEALKIADEYWGHVDGGMDAAAGTTYFHKVVISNDLNPICPYYRIAWKMERYHHWDEGWESRPPSSIEIYEEVLVNIYTGKCAPCSVLEPDGKG